MQLDFVPQAKCIHFRTSNLYTRTRTACSNFGQLLMSIRLKLRQFRCYVVKCDLVLTIETRDGFENWMVVTKTSNHILWIKPFFSQTAVCTFFCSLMMFFYGSFARRYSFSTWETNTIMFCSWKKVIGNWKPGTKTTKGFLRSRRWQNKAITTTQKEALGMTTTKTPKLMFHFSNTPICACPPSRLINHERQE